MSAATGAAQYTVWEQISVKETAALLDTTVTAKENYLVMEAKRDNILAEDRRDDQIIFDAVQRKFRRSLVLAGHRVVIDELKVRERKEAEEKQITNAAKSEETARAIEEMKAVAQQALDEAAARVHKLVESARDDSRRSPMGEWM
jgi:hypothetical protein